MAVNENTQANNKYREKIIRQVTEFLKSDKGGDQWVRQVSSNAIAFPFVNELGNDETVKITISIPTGDRSGEPYDMESEADEYERKQAEKVERQKEAEEKKKKKIEADKKRREKAEQLKAQRGVK